MRGWRGGSWTSAGAGRWSCGIVGPGASLRGCIGCCRVPDRNAHRCRLGRCPAHGSRPAAYHRLLTTGCLPPAAYHRLLTTGCLPPAAYHRLLTTGCLPPAAYHRLLTTGCLPPAAYHRLLTTGCLPPAAYHRLLTTGCLPPAAYHRLLTTGCLPPAAYRGSRWRREPVRLVAPVRGGPELG